MKNDNKENPRPEGANGAELGAVSAGRSKGSGPRSPKPRGADGSEPRLSRRQGSPPNAQKPFAPCRRRCRELEYVSSPLKSHPLRELKKSKGGKRSLSGRLQRRGHQATRSAKKPYKCYLACDAASPPPAQFSFGSVVGHLGSPVSGCFSLERDSTDEQHFRRLAGLVALPKPLRLVEAVQILMGALLSALWPPNFRFRRRPLRAYCVACVAEDLSRWLLSLAQRRKGRLPGQPGPTYRSETNDLRKPPSTQEEAAKSYARQRLETYSSDHR
ncbi:hypothetical protein CB1_000398023 [Camelus ferus]|nr:hypothetical protein CB1_000398023 [Camelus ferus]